MEEFLSVQNAPQVEFNQKNFFKTKKGEIIAAVLGIIIIIFMLVALNYFNILPNQQIQTTKQDNKPIQNPTVSGFTYDASKAQAQLTQYLKDKIKPEFVPSTITIIPIGEKDNIRYAFGANWNKSTVFVQSNFYYDLKTNNPREIEFFINLKDISTINSSTAQSITNTYLKDIPPNTKFDCGTFKDASYCESFSSTEKSKHGFGLLAGEADKDHPGRIFSCYIPNKSSSFVKTTSCLLFREK